MLILLIRLPAGRKEKIKYDTEQIGLELTYSRYMCSAIMTAFEGLLQSVAASSVMPCCAKSLPVPLISVL